MAIMREELPGPAEEVYPACLIAIGELLRLTQPNNPWLETLDEDLELFRDNHQVTQTLFYTNMGTLPDNADRDPWINACFNNLLWLGQVAGKKITPRTYGMPLWAAIGSTALCPRCHREYMLRDWIGIMAAKAWALDAIPRLLIEVGPEATARRSIEAADDPDCGAILAQVERLVAGQNIEITKENPITWPRAKCPACGSVLGTRSWTVSGSPLRLTAGEVGE
jgi:RNA polymerase subunit RPABC4/transcription elongation factor Spt4